MQRRCRTPVTMAPIVSPPSVPSSNYAQSHSNQVCNLVAISVMKCQFFHLFMIKEQRLSNYQSPRYTMGAPPAPPNQPPPPPPVSVMAPQAQVNRNSNMSQHAYVPGRESMGGT